MAGRVLHRAVLPSRASTVKVHGPASHWAGVLVPDTAIIPGVKEGLGGWTSQADMNGRPRVRPRGESGLPDLRRRRYIHADKLRHTNTNTNTNTEAPAALTRAGRYAPRATICGSQRSRSLRAGTAMTADRLPNIYGSPI